MTDQKKHFDYMKGVKLIAVPPTKVDLIISVDLAATWCLPRDFRRGLPFQPIAILTEWGWTLLGGGTPLPSSLLSYFIRIDKDFLSEKLDRIFNEDFKGLPGDNDMEKLSREESRALIEIGQSITLHDQRYTVSAPWKRSQEETFQTMASIDSYKTAKTRLDSLGRRMDRDLDFKN